jgi:Cellulose binding domain
VALRFTANWGIWRLCAGLTIAAAASLVSIGATGAYGATTPGPLAAFQTVSTWSGGYTANFTISNGGPGPLTTWSLAFVLPVGSSIVNSWNGNPSETGTQVTVTNASWNGSIAPGSSTTFGFQVSYTGTDAPPTACTINGVANCTGTGSSGSGTSGTGTSGSGSGTSGTGTSGTGTSGSGTGSSGSGTSGTGTSGSGTGTSGSGTGTSGSGTGTQGAGAGSLVATFGVTGDWGTGYTGAFTIRNSGTATVATWTLAVAFPPGGLLSEYGTAGPIRI